MVYFNAEGYAIIMAGMSVFSILWIKYGLSRAITISAVCITALAFLFIH